MTTQDQLRPVHPGEVYISETVPAADIDGFVQAINKALVDAGAKARHGAPLRVTHPIWTPRHRVHPDAQLKALDRFREHWDIVTGHAQDGNEAWCDFTPRVPK